jgi:hypothetical protein
MSTTITEAPCEARDTSASRQRVGSSAGLGLLCLAQFMVALDASIADVAVPSIPHAPGFNQTASRWWSTPTDAYALTFAGFLLLAKRRSSPPAQQLGG